MEWFSSWLYEKDFPVGYKWGFGWGLGMSFWAKCRVVLYSFKTNLQAYKPHKKHLMIQLNPKAQQLYPLLNKITFE